MNNNHKLSLIDEPAQKKKKQGPTLLQRSAKSVNAFGRGVRGFLTSGVVWFCTLAGGGIWVVTDVVKDEARKQDAFEQRMEKALTDNGYKVLAADAYSQTDNEVDPSKRLKFPKDFERAAIITAQKGNDIYDFAAVRKTASRSGYVQEKFVDQQLFDHPGPGLKK